MKNNPLLTKVFLALRTNFVPDYPREHVTLRYYKRVRWDVLMNDCDRLDKKLPATIVHDGSIHSWRAGTTRYSGLHVTAPDSLVLDHLNMPHISIPQVYLEKFVIGDAQSHEVVDTLWLGKKVNDQYIWARVSKQPIGVEDGNRKLDWSASGLI